MLNDDGMNVEVGNCKKITDTGKSMKSDFNK
jgi:hypothetical protein